MLLFERVKKVALAKAGSVKGLAERLGKSQQAFAHYMSPETEYNLWRFLPQILELYPDVSREWLFFGEGDMDAGNEPSRSSLLAENAKLKAELEEERALNRRLVNRVLLSDADAKDTDHAPAAGE